MSNEERETSNIIMAVRGATMMMDPMFKLFAAGTASLITYLARMRKERLISKMEFSDTMEFIKVTEGQYTIVNIPYTQENHNPWSLEQTEIEGKTKYHIRNTDTGEYLMSGKKKATFVSKKAAGKEADKLNAVENHRLDELKDLGIRHVVMPDLNKSDGMVQVAVYNPDKDSFSAWYERYLNSKMVGGSHDLRELKNLTEGRTSMISIPLEGKEAVFKNDFKELGINYAILPDLNVGDGEIQIVVANCDLQKVQLWYDLYRSDLQKRGVEIKDMRMCDMADYKRTGEMTEDEYIDSSGAELVKANEKYEGKEPGEIEKSVRKQENRIHSKSDAAYEKYHADPGYLEVTMNRESLIEKSSFACTPSAKLMQEEKGLFASRIPGTWGDSERTLFLPIEQVFETDNGNTYIAFIKKDERQIVMGADGGLLSDSERPTGKMLQESYNEIDRGVMERKRKSALTRQPEKGAKGVGKPKEPEPEGKRSEAGTEKTLDQGRMPGSTQEHVKPDKKNIRNNSNFSQRRYDYSELEGALLAHDKPSSMAADTVKKAAKDISPGIPVKVK